MLHLKVKKKLIKFIESRKINLVHKEGCCLEKTYFFQKGDLITFILNFSGGKKIKNHTTRF